MKKLFDWIINSYTYVQIFIFICLLFIFSLVPIGYFWIQTHLRQIRILEAQRIGLKEEAILEKFLGQIQEHRLLSQRNFRKGTEGSKELQILNNQILDTLQKGEDFNQLKSTNKNTQGSFWQTIDPIRLKIKWNEINEQLPNVSKHENEILHTAFLHDIVIQFPYLGDRVGVGYFAQFDKYVLIQNIFVRLPSMQEYLAQLIVLSLEILQNPASERPIQRINSLLVLLNSDLQNLEQGIALHNVHQTEIDHQQILDAVNTYRNGVLGLLQTVKTAILNVPQPTIPFAEFQQESEKALKNGFRLWEEGMKILETIFKTEIEYIFFRLWFVLFITILLTSFAVFLGLALILTAIKRLSNLTAATESFTQGNLTVRVVDPYIDQIGRQAAVFNRMAQKLEATIKHLYELLDATTALANGNLTARIQTIPQDKEFEQVALSFNTMADTFEKIIGRLQKTGRLLTTSASKIATASKEQETIVVKQEETTREISQTSGEISSTARAFAQTMNEVSFAAERTSDLAVSGKDSLSHMEKIMQTMVDASQGIASKLAILSEKASNITTVITTITKVADQTNLLSLNASIEAEKAGEFGRGFAVIAREIRRLADQTAISLLDIEKMIHEITTAISESVSGVGDFTQGIENGTEGVRAAREQLTAIIEQVQAFTSQIEGVNQGMQAQSAGAEQINQAIARLSQTAAQTTTAIHQFHKTMQELNHLANELSILNPFTSKD